MLKIKYLLFIALFFGVCLDSFAQEKQIITFTSLDSTKIIINELLVYNKNTQVYEPYTAELTKFRDKKHTPLGIRHYNFGCIKTKTKELWLGQIAKDAKGHAIFKEPIFGVTTFIQLAITYIKRGVDTPYKFFDRYAPHTDCLGSVDKVLVNGKLECPNGYNKPEIYAKTVADGIGIGINDPISIYDKEGKLNAKLFTLLLSSVASFELGLKCKFEEETIKKAIKLINVK